MQNSVQTLRSPASGFATIVLHNLHRANHFTMAAVYIRCRYPMEVFGTLMGTFRCSMGITVLINVGLNVIITKYADGFNSGNRRKSSSHMVTIRHRNFLCVTVLSEIRFYLKIRSRGLTCFCVIFREDYTSVSSRDADFFFERSDLNPI